MFDNIGGKIKALAMGITILGITASVIWGLTILLEGDFVGLVIMLGGSLAAWIGSFLIYGFGELIDNTRQLIDIGKSCKGSPNSDPAQGFAPVSTPKMQPTSKQVAHAWRCPHCGNMISQTPCPYCNWQES